ncbi:gamma-tubulin complex component 3 [Episyrphus balteatus]|uniref:gamma-tubulin complex component 3 n=1 Tax=Episyrphus balteatus TaxID=286459 RepID=UPI002486241E|nr:gamma-tubulin complex component 3 [Episyrphus balteatus]
MTNRANYKDIYDLLEKLCKNVCPNNHRQVLGNVTQYISNCPTGLGSSLPYNETSLVSKISSHLTNTSGSQSSATLFLNLYEQLKTSQTDQRQRSALLTFLYFMADSQNNMMSLSTNGFNNAITNNQDNNGPGVSSALNSIRSSMLQKPTHHFNPGVTIGRPALHGFGNQKSSTMNSPPVDSNLKISTLRTTHNNHQLQSDSSDTGSKDAHLSQQALREAQNDLNDDIVQNVIYAFTGIQGKYLKKDVISGAFKLDTKAKKLNVVQAGMLLRLSELGYYHDQVQSYTDTKSGLCALGLMGQGFISALKTELTKYYGMVAMLQEQLNKQRKTERQEWMSTLAPVEKVTLMKILVWSVDPLQRLQWLATIAEACQEKKGGALASIVHSFLSNGDPMVKSVVKEMLLAICGPLQQMLSRWLLEGEICDPHGEFFIECLSEVSPDRLWHDKYRVRTSMLPDFISTDMANKILITGKSINFLREICEDKSPVKGREELRQCFELNAENIFSKVADTKLHSTIDSVYLNTSKRVLDIVMGPHKLLEHLQAMRRYLLLGQGDFIGILMENLKSELDKPAKELYSYDLSSILDAAIRNTNAQYDDPEILNHLDVRLLHPYDGDTGWDILSLQYTVRGPLATMLDPSMDNYQILFKPLWRMKHIEFLLSSKIWKDQMCNAKPLRTLKNQLNPIMYRLHLFTSEMIHFIHQMQYYILFEVIECSWAEFQEKIQQAKTLDDILHAHDEFLTTIKSGAFLDSKSEALSAQMEEVYLGITRLEVWQDKFFDICFKELKATKEFEEAIRQSEKVGEFGVNAEQQLQRDEEHKIFEQSLNSCQKNLEKIGFDYEVTVRQFLLELNSNNDHNLQLFGIRLDFNEYYKKRDQRLNKPLTFESMRVSNVFGRSRYSIN